jgi:hypothetical protein
MTIPILSLVGSEANAPKDLLMEIMREGARKMLVAALEAEVEDFISSCADSRDERGKRLVVRNGHARARDIITPLGPLEVRTPRVHDKRRNEEGKKVSDCKDVNRKGDFEEISFDFLGFTFRPRKAQDMYGRRYVNFSPAISRSAMKEIYREMRSWHLQLRSDKELCELSARFNPVITGWWNYYGRFYGTAMKPIWRQINLWLTRWIRQKHKRFRKHKMRASQYLGKLARANPKYFVHWQKGYLPTAG